MPKDRLSELHLLRPLNVKQNVHQFSKIHFWFMVSGVPDQMSQTFSVGLWSVVFQTKCLKRSVLVYGQSTVVFQTKCFKSSVLVYDQWCSRPNVPNV